MKEIINTVRGFKDILPREAGRWQFVEQTAREIFSAFGFNEIRIPIVEKTDLFKRGIGEATDIVEKEMYTFLDRGNEYLTLRPEATAGVIRSFIEHSLHAEDAVTKLYTFGPMFRRERPQKGRYRQFHQIDAEILGVDDPRIDAELILMLMHFLAAVGLAGSKLEINSLGCKDCRPVFRKMITDFVRGKEAGFCPDCTRRMDTNPLRIFDCKVETCREIMVDAPVVLDALCETCRVHFAQFQEALTLFALPFEINPRMVRGLDYYTKTAFEITTELLGAQNAVAGGGRYDGLVKDLGGPDTPGIGFAIGFERLVALMHAHDEDFFGRPDLFIAALGAEAQGMAFALCNKLRLAGIRTEMDYAGKSLKSQMKRADKFKCRYAMIIGDQEIANNQAMLRDMEESKQAPVGFHQIEHIKRVIKGDKPLV